MPEPPKQPLPPILEGWLRIAARGLCESAVKRIQSEVSTHYREAIDHFGAKGLTERLAQAHAIEALGDPFEAGRAFRKVYLARWQERFLSVCTDTREILYGCALDLFAVWVLITIADGIAVPGYGVFGLAALCMAWAMRLMLCLLLARFCLLPQRTPSEGKRLQWLHLSFVQRAFSRRPRMVTIALLLLCVPYVLWVARTGTIWEMPTLWLFTFAFIWGLAFEGAWRLLFQERWNLPIVRDVLAVALGLALAGGAVTVIQHAIRQSDGMTMGSFIRAFTHNDEFPNLWIGVIGLFLMAYAAATFVALWLVHKRGNGPSQATPEPVRDDAI